MSSFDPTTLALWTGGIWTDLPVAPTGFSVDSRRMVPGQAFVALKTGIRDGHDFLGAALKAGASAALVARADPGIALPQLVVPDPLLALQAIAREHRRTFRGTVVAITGSAGKTSTKELLALLLGGDEGRVLATEANLNNQIGVALTLTRIDATLHRFAVIEAGISAPGEMATLAAMIEPDIVIVTLVAPAHLDDLGGIEGVAREKAVLAGSLRKGGVCIYPSSCEVYPQFAALPGASCLVLEPAGKCEGREARPGRVRFIASHSGESTAVSVEYGPPPPITVTLRRVTEGMAQNVAMAVCAAHRLGTDREDIQRRLHSWLPAPLRGEWRISEGRRLYLDCYNANPASMADALSAFNAVAPVSEGRLYILGCMEELGAEAHRYHLELGRSLSLRHGDYAFVVGSMAGAVRQGAIESGCEPSQVEVADVADLVSVRLAAFHGSVFVKGSRRHALERAVAGADFAEVFHA